MAHVGQQRPLGGLGRVSEIKHTRLDHSGDQGRNLG